ncbi:MAG: hypothetical protein IKB37_04205 [Rikenellaceae bacterium]|nr:hypothetical protein [Rikenellaceae bacterium]
MILTLIVLIACCIVFAAPLNVSFVIIGLVFWAGAGYDAKIGCLGRLIDMILMFIGTILIIIGFCLT